MKIYNNHSQVLVIGSGIAGATTALVLANSGVNVTLIVPGKNLDGSNSQFAQGGIVYTTSIEDSRQLEKDIITAGHSQNYINAVRFLCKRGPEAIQRLLMERITIPFDWDSFNNKLNFTREGGHSTARIIHCADHTGKSIMDGLIHAIKQSSNIQLLTSRTAIDLITLTII